jgi:hypothetical protein
MIEERATSCSMKDIVGEGRGDEPKEDDIERSDIESEGTSAAREDKTVAEDDDADDVEDTGVDVVTPMLDDAMEVIAGGRLG